MFYDLSLMFHRCVNDISKSFQGLFKGCSRIIQWFPMIFHNCQWRFNDLSMIFMISKKRKKKRRKEGRKEGKTERKKERKNERKNERKEKGKLKNVMVLRHAMVPRNVYGAQERPEKRYCAQKRYGAGTPREASWCSETLAPAHTHMLTHTRARTLSHRFTLVLVSIASGSMRNLSKHLEVSASVWERKVAAGCFWNHPAPTGVPDAQIPMFRQFHRRNCQNGSRNSQLLLFAPRRCQKLPNA